MIIGSCGFGGTGSSVLTDLLSEYDDVDVKDSFEFVLPYISDGLEDLEYHLMKQYAKGESSDVAIRRFLRRTKLYCTPFINKPCKGKTFRKYSEEFINEITQCKFKGMYTVDTCTGYILRDILAFGLKKIIMPRIIEKIIKRPSFLWPCHLINYSIEPENFYIAAKRYTGKIIESMGVDRNKIICLDQPFSGNAPENSMKFFDDAYAIVIDRDPRDLFFEYKYTKSCDGKFMPRSSVKDYVTYFKNMRKNIKENDKVLRMNFEELIYEYDLSVHKIEEFLGIHKHTRIKKRFDPARSINNTQQIRLHPEDKMNIKYIEKHLSEYLFPFEKYEATFTGDVFYGATRQVTK